MRTAPCILTSLLLSATAFAQSGTLIYDNGPIQTGTDPVSGNAVSALQNATLGHNIYGWGAQEGAGNRMADQFCVNSAMVIDEIELFFYQTGATAVSITSAHVRILDSDPASGPTSNDILNGNAASPNNSPAGTAPSFTPTVTLSGVYRVLEGGLGVTNRQLQSCVIAVSPPLVISTPGIYWIEVSAQGSLSSGPWVPPTAATNVDITGDQQQTTGASGTYTTVLNGATGTQGLPFRFYSNSPVGNPGGVTNLGGAATTTALTYDVSAATVPGGFIHGELSGVGPTLVPLVLLSFSSPGVPIISCGGSLNSGLDVVVIGTSADVQIPNDCTLSGLNVFTQGAGLDLLNTGSQPCNFLGIQFDLSDAFGVSIAVL